MFRPERQFTAVSSKFGVDIADAGSSCQSEKMIELFTPIAIEQGWRTGEDLVKYMDSSVLITLNEGSNAIAGMKLVLCGGVDGLPINAVWPELHLCSRNDIADLALLAVDAKYRGYRQNLWVLASIAWRLCLDRGICELWAEITPATLRIYQKLGWPFEIAGPLRDHWGEPCYPCRMFIADGFQSVVNKAQKSEFFMQLLLTHCPEYETLLP